MQRQAIHVSEKPGFPFSAGIKAGDFIFVSGQVGHLDDKGNSITGIEAQTKRCLENLVHVLYKAGASLSDVVKVTVFLKDIKNYPKMNEVYRTYFSADPPARSTAVCELGMPEMLIEIDCIAYSPGK
jgi:2-iminobutanoate/2-iminopropanoate deaminase